MADGRRSTLLWFLEQVAVPNKPRGCLPCESVEGHSLWAPLVAVGVSVISVVVLARLQVSLPWEHAWLLSAPEGPSCAAAVG